jgi:IS5 family transposase
VTHLPQNATTESRLPSPYDQPKLERAIENMYQVTRRLDVTDLAMADRNHLRVLLHGLESLAQESARS